MASVSPSLVILGCGQRKKRTSRLLPAIDRYDGPAFRVLRKHKREALGGSPDSCILSARFGLIPGNLPIPRYDCEIADTDQVELRVRVEGQFKRMVEELQPRRIFVSLGSRYLPLIAESLCSELSSADLLIATGSIGGRASQLAHWLRINEDVKIGQGPPKGSAVLLGSSVRLTREEVLEAARNALRVSPAGAFRFETWYVAVGEHRVAPKWLVSILFGKPVRQFRTADARRVLGNLGVECHYRERSLDLSSKGDRAWRMELRNRPSTLQIGGLGF
jgi:hypothetical protein